MVWLSQKNETLIILWEQKSQLDQVCQGLKRISDTTFLAITGNKSGKINPLARGSAETLLVMLILILLDLQSVLQPSLITRADLLGTGWPLTVPSQSWQEITLQWAYWMGDFELHTNNNNGTEFGGSVYQKVCDNLDTSVHFAWTSSTNCTHFVIDAKYQLHFTASVFAKVNNSSLIGVERKRLHLHSDSEACCEADTFCSAS